MLLVFTTLLIVLQRTFWCRLLTIPLSILSILAARQVLEFSGLVVFVFCLVFVGGLLLLIVIVSTLSHQERRFIISIISIIIIYVMSYLFFLGTRSIDYREKMNVIFWYEKIPRTLRLPLLSLFISLVAIRVFLSNSKIIRRII
jgi:uncharacterized protein YacL